jgi:uncharacterized protein (TIGR03435 family)
MIGGNLSRPWRLGSRSSQLRFGSSKSKFHVLTGVVVLSAGFLNSTLNAQSATSHGQPPALINGESKKLISFDVVSIRKASAPGWLTRFTKDGFEADATPVQYLLRVAFSSQVAPPDILNVPKWAAGTYDIRAKVAEEDIEEYNSLSREQQNMMLQRLLSERFHLRFHFGTREHSAYEMRLLGSGSKLTSHQAGKEYSGNGDNEPLMPVDGALRFRANPDSMAHLARRLSWTGDVEHKAVVDRSGLNGFYKFDLTWCPFQEDANPPTTNCNGPSLFTALKEQLGLELRPIKASFPTLIVDELDRPSPN